VARTGHRLNVRAHLSARFRTRGAFFSYRTGKNCAVISRILGFLRGRSARVSSSAKPLARAEPLTALPRSARSRVSWSLAEFCLRGHPHRPPNRDLHIETFPQPFTVRIRPGGVAVPDTRRDSARTGSRFAPFGARASAETGARTCCAPLRILRAPTLASVMGGQGSRRESCAGAFQSEREEETRDRAERGSVVRGSDQASVATKRTPLADPNSDL
jgi:hypothetical protein